MPRIEIPIVFCNTVVPFTIFDPSYNKGFRFVISELPQFVIKVATICKIKSHRIL